MEHQIKIVADAVELASEAADEFVRLAQAAVRQKNLFTVALSGGSTPKILYSLLANEEPWRSNLPWERIHFFWGDERHVPPSDPDSNYRMTYEAMLSKAPVPASNVHRIKGEEPDAQTAAAEYEQELRSFFHLQSKEYPRFDLILLGMGPDGHTASLFPGTDALKEHEQLVVANWVEKFNAYRITLTLPVLNNAANVIFLVSGAEKAEVLRAILKGDSDTKQFPAQLIRPVRGKLLWLIDETAAAALNETAS